MNLECMLHESSAAQCCVIVFMTSLSVVSLATDPYSAPSFLLCCLLLPPCEGSYLAAQMQMKLLDLVEGIRWH